MRDSCRRSDILRSTVAVLGTVGVIAASGSALFARQAPAAANAPGVGHADLVAFFAEWRKFQAPKTVDGAPDYSAAAMAAQHRELAGYQARLRAMHPQGWSIPQQVDYHLIRAEMNGLDFDHRVLRPWANNPAFYVTVFAAESDQPAREGPFAVGAVELWKYPTPLTPAAVGAITPGIKAIPTLLARAKTNLVGDGRDLWVWGEKSLRAQSDTLADLAAKLGTQGASLKDDVDRAKAATDDLASWVQQQAASKKGPSGIGVENYDWYLRNVQLLPYTWRDEVELCKRELARSVAWLALEETRNASLPSQEPISSEEEHADRSRQAVDEYMAFLRDRNIMTVRDYMEPALRERTGMFRPGPREFFTEVDYRDKVVMRTHGYHWFDKGRMIHMPYANAIRRAPMLYNAFITRTEGLATAWEEMMMHAGLFDARPRSRELIAILLAQRAARALGDLRMHGREFTLDEASRFASANTPRGWLRLDANTVWREQHLYLQQPGYGTSYVIGKIQIDELLADRKRQLGDGFKMKEFMDTFDAAGQIPITLIRWEMTG